MIKRRYKGPLADEIMDLLGEISRDVSIYGHEALDENSALTWEDAVLKLAEIVKARRMLDLMQELTPRD